MDSSRVVELYKRGHSVDYIINEYYRSVNKNNRVTKLKSGRIIYIEDRIKKSKCREMVYKILYKLNKNRY